MEVILAVGLSAVGAAIYASSAPPERDEAKGRFWGGFLTCLAVCVFIALIANGWATTAPAELVR